MSGDGVSEQPPYVGSFPLELLNRMLGSRRGMIDLARDLVLFFQVNLVAVLLQQVALEALGILPQVVPQAQLATPCSALRICRRKSRPTRRHDSGVPGEAPNRSWDGLGDYGRRIGSDRCSSKSLVVSGHPADFWQGFEGTPGRRAFYYRHDLGRFCQHRSPAQWAKPDESKSAANSSARSATVSKWFRSRCVKPRSFLE